jgi:hypothetical protein
MLEAFTLLGKYLWIKKVAGKMQTHSSIIKLVIAQLIWQFANHGDHVK